MKTLTVIAIMGFLFSSTGCTNKERSIRLYENSKLCEVSYYVKNDSGQYHRTGEYVLYYPSGQTWIRGQWENGLRQGEWTYYRDNGKLDYEGPFRNDTMEGTWKAFDTTGRKIFEAWMSDNAIKKEFTFFTANGTIIDSLVDGKNSKLTRNEKNYREDFAFLCDVREITYGYKSDSVTTAGVVFGSAWNEYGNAIQEERRKDNEQKYRRFRASKAFEELDKETKEYEEAKKKQQ